MSVRGMAERHGARAVAGVVALLVVGALITTLTDISVRNLITVGYVNRSLEMAAPIVLVALGGLYAEKSGVFNIGLEGFMIIGAFVTAATMFLLGGTSPSQAHIWLAILVAVVVTSLFTAVFAVLLIRYQADQIVAGLGVWFVALGFAPFGAALIWGSRSSPGLTNIANLTVPGLAELPVVGSILFDQSPLVWLAAAFVGGAWVVLYRTRFGYWVQAAGENPEALDTAGVNVTRVRYVSVIFSGAMAGLAGGVLMAHAGNFIGIGQTMVNGRGWLGIVAYLFGNYNPVGAAAAGLLFGGLDMLNVQFQTVGVNISSRLVNLFPYVIVIAVLTLWGKTRSPAALGEPYESED